MLFRVPEAKYRRNLERFIALLDMETLAGSALSEFRQQIGFCTGPRCVLTSGRYRTPNVGGVAYVGVMSGNGQ